MSRQKIFFRLSVVTLVIANGLTIYEEILKDRNQAAIKIGIFDLSAVMFIVTSVLLIMTYQKKGRKEVMRLVFPCAL